MMRIMPPPKERHPVEGCQLMVTIISARSVPSLHDSNRHWHSHARLSRRRTLSDEKTPFDYKESLCSTAFNCNILP